MTEFLTSARRAWLGNAATAVLLFLSFPPLGHPFLGFIALVPAALAAASRPEWKDWRRSAFTCSWILWVALLVWLRHVHPPLGPLGLLLLTAWCALFPWAWLLLLRWILPACGDAGLPARLLAMLGLAGAWALLEWTRSTALTGFGWLPLAASQTGNPVMLSLCAWAGPTGLSAALVLLNLGLARWALRLAALRTEGPAPAGPAGWLSRLTPELYLGLVPVGLSFLAFLSTGARMTLNAHDEVRIGAVQTDFNPYLKWDSARLGENVELVRKLTLDAAGPGRADLVLWPEAALPLSLDAPGYASLLRETAAAARTTLVVGVIERRGAGYANSVTAVSADGIAPAYAKRHLVPFGEYVPLADFLPLRKVVPIAEDCVAGDGPTLLPVTSAKGRTFAIGPLVCYEDVFPSLARDHALAGADMLAVVTNDAWYGREAGAYQHAAHSTLIAAATGLPVIRCGNAGWSGTIDRQGRAEPFRSKADGSIYFRGGVGTLPVRLPTRPETTFWVRHGDWAPGLGGLFLAGAYVWRRRRDRRA
ncbi:MAG: apolipoprotein N-acyltransferase [Opitutales bacterium]|jgi:apolipoprotein N-acyltransferase